MIGRPAVIVMIWAVLAAAAARAQESYVYPIVADNKVSLTGFRLRGTKGIVTALHGVVEAGTITAKSLQGGRLEQPLRLVKVDIRRDLALLTSPEVERMGDDGLEPIGDESWAEVGELQLIGYPMKLDWKELRTTLKVRQPPLVELSALVDPRNRDALKKRGSPDTSLPVLSVQGDLLPGHSGAPLLDARGRVVAVGNGGLKDGTIGIGWAIPLRGVEWQDARPELISDLRSHRVRELYILAGDDAGPRYRLTLKELRCQRTEDTTGPDEAFLKVAGEVFWGPVEINDGQVRSIDRSVDFKDHIQIDLFDEDVNRQTPFGLIDPHDYLGTAVIGAGKTGEGQAYFTEDDAVYILRYTVEEVP